ncbi:MAG: NAD+ synthase [Ignisphaera sp.]|nr:NAD+ synthase [Ignisphaera sp.]MCX8167467.1 NAD+ synthase [Ignisphaera sp.]MDW8084669.1 NAD+ synthase [Ignisphaera sp.]
MTVSRIVPVLDYNYIARRVAQFLEEMLRKTDARGYVIGLSGGIDSTTVTYLVVKMLGRDKLKVLIMPDSNVTPEEDVEDAIYVAKVLGVEYYLFDVSKLIDSFSRILPFFDIDHNLSVGNLRARIRMASLYYFANRFNMLVVGTGNKSELLLGYFTKYGDGGADVLPLGDLYKVQVRDLARFLGVPEKIVCKPSSPRLWKNQLTEDELGLKYELIDSILYLYVDKRMDARNIASILGIHIDSVINIIRRIYRSEHKRRPPAIPRLTTTNIAYDLKLPMHIEDQEPEV